MPYPLAIAAAAAVFAVQLLLCLHARRRALKLAPAALCALLLAASCGAYFAASGSEGLAATVIAALSALLLLACGAAWAAGGLIRLICRHHGA